MTIIGPTESVQKLSVCWKCWGFHNDTLLYADLLFCCSGEKTSISEWSSALEIKGRVRLDAFEKFIKELPLSRSRAVMVPQGPLLFIGINIRLLFCYSSVSCLLRKRQCSSLILRTNQYFFSIIRMYSYAPVTESVNQLRCLDEWFCFFKMHFKTNRTCSNFKTKPLE